MAAFLGQLLSRNHDLKFFNKPEPPLIKNTKLLFFVLQSETAERKEVAASGNIVEGLLEIVNMITDNPGLKNDLQEYFQETRRSGTSKRRRQTRQSLSNFKCLHYLTEITFYYYISE